MRTLRSKSVGWLVRLLGRDRRQDAAASDWLPRPHGATGGLGPWRPLSVPAVTPPGCGGCHAACPVSGPRSTSDREDRR